MAAAPIAMAPTLGELAVQFGCELRGDPEIRVDRVAALAEAGHGALCFVVNKRWIADLRATRASAVILDAALLGECPAAALVHRNPHAVYARIAQRLHPLPVARSGRHPTASIAADAVIDPSAEVQAQAFVGAGACIGARCVVGAGAYVGAGVRLGDDTRIWPRATLCDGVILGARCIVHPGAVVGGDGFGYANDRGTWVRVPQLGTVVLGDDVDIGCNSSIDRGALGDTVIEEGVKIDNQVQVGHNCRIGAHTAIAAQVGLSGSTVIGRRCQLGGRSGSTGHLSICDDVVVMGCAVVTASITEPGAFAGIWPAEPAGEWRRLVAEFKRIGRLRERVRALERRAGDAGKEESDS